MIKPWRRKMAIIGTVFMGLFLFGLIVAGIVVTIPSPQVESNETLDINMEIAGQKHISVNISDATNDSLLQAWYIDVFTILFPALGLAGTVIPTVYHARDRKVKGILMHEMTKYFFPCYGIIMLENIVLALVGQVCCAIGEDKLLWWFFFGLILSTVYAAALVLGTGLHERVTQFYVDVYIADNISELAVIQQKNNSGRTESDQKRRTDRSKFLAAISEHIAEKIANTECPFFINDNERIKEICQISKVITYQRKRDNPELEGKYGFIDSFDTIFKYADFEVESSAISENVFYTLPASNNVRVAFSKQVTYAYEFWQNVLRPCQSIGQEAKAACRILYAMNFEHNKLNDNYVIIGCGLIVYLYRKYHSNSSEHQMREVDQCAVFIDHMTYVFRNEYCNETPEELRDILKMCTDLLFTVWVIALTEEYSVYRSYDSVHLHESIDRLILGESGYLAITTHVLGYVSKYMALGWIVIKQLPSIANKAWTMEQKRKMLAYVQQQLNSYQEGMSYE